MIVASEKDLASMNMANNIKNANDFIEIKSFEKGCLYKKDDLILTILKDNLTEVDYLDNYFKDRTYVFLSKHMSKDKIPAITAHFTGNFSEDNKFGGNSNEIAITFPSLHKNLIRELWNRKNEVTDYEIITEPTHHGPTNLTNPMIFLELGSSIKNWTDKKAGKIIGETLIECINNFKSAKKIAIALGGPHYSQKFTKILIESEYAIGTIVPKYSLPYINEKTYKSIIKQTIEKIEYVIIDWKGLGKEKQRIMEIVNKHNLDIIKI